MAKQVIISTPDAPAAIGPYSQAIQANGMLFTAGQIPLDPVTMEVVEGGIEAQAERVMQSLGKVLEAGGASFGSVVKTTCFLADLNDFAAFNTVYAKYFGESVPARSTVQAAKLPRGVMVEVEAIAIVG